MRALSIFFTAVGVLAIFGSVVSIGLTYLDQIRGEPRAPTHTGAFIVHYFGVDLSSLRIFQLAGVQQAVSFVLDERLYTMSFALGLLLLFAAMLSRNVRER
jgi:hypothetical protein